MDSNSKEWQDIVSWVDDLPPLPTVAARAISMLEDEGVSSEEVVELISSDPALAARVLKVANSALFARQREVNTLAQSVTIIGFKALKGIIVGATLRQLNKKYSVAEKMIWENSLCTAVAAHVIATHTRRAYVDEIFLLGLLHDLGKVILVIHAAEEYARVIEITKHGKDYLTAEQEIFGFHHCLVGALIAKKWNFSVDTCQVIFRHHEQVRAPILSQQIEKTTIVQAADGVAHVLGYGHLEGYPNLKEQLYMALSALRVSEETANILINDSKEAFLEQQGLFG